jgi:hypothetical protein
MAWKLLLRLMCPGKDFAWPNESRDQLAFLDGQVQAFTHLGGAPWWTVCDTLSSPVERTVGVDREH